MKKDKRIKDRFIDISNVDKQYIVIGSDIHIPFQDDEAVRAFVDYCTTLKPKYIVLNGDILDMYRLSKFAKGEGRNPKYEIEMCRELLKTLRDACPDSKIFYVIGNHETRYEKYILERAPEIESLMDDIFTLIQTEKYQVAGASSLNFGNQFIVTHGTFVAKYSGMSAIKEFMNTFMSGATGHCFSEDVEVLTQKGWKRIIDIDPKKDIVGTYNKKTGAFEYNKIKEKFVYDNYKSLYHIKSNCIDIMTTDKHGFIGYKQNRELIEFTADELPSVGKISIPLACKENKITHIECSDDELRLLINICADACIEDDSFRFHLKKERKVEHLKDLLNRLNLEYSERKQTCGTTKIRLTIKASAPYLKKYFKDKIKILPEIIRYATPKQARIILEEYSITDGCKNASAKNSYQISTSKRTEADILQELFVKSGMRTSVFKRKNGNYCITVNLRNETTIDGRRNVSVVPYKGKVSCVSVDNGTLVVRSKGKTIITQNTHRLAKFSIRKRNREFFWLETGCLCGLDPEYMLYPDWQQGFGVVRIDNGQISDGAVIPIKDGSIRWL